MAEETRHAESAHQHGHRHADDAHHEHDHSHGLVDPSILRSRAGVRVVLISLGILGATAVVQTAIYLATDSVAPCWPT